MLERSRIAQIVAWLVAAMLVPSAARAAAAPLVDLNGDGKVVVLCFGDSITAGSMRGSYPGGLRQRFGKDVTIINQGRFGETTRGGVARLRQVLPEAHADYVIILEGVNDHNDSADTTYAHLEEMVADVGRARAAPLVGTLFPSPQKAGEERSRAIEALNARILRMHDVTPLDFAARFRDHWDVLLGPGGVHPTSKGYEVIEEVAAEGLMHASRAQHAATRASPDRHGAQDAGTRH